MPELPEVETIRQGLRSHVVGSRILSGEVSHPRVLRNQPGGEDELRGLTNGWEITGVQRRGKYLWLTLGDQNTPVSHALLVHLGMSGQVLLKDSPTEGHRHLRVAFTLENHQGDQRHLWYVEQRSYGYVTALEVVPDPHGQGFIPESMPHIGPDLLEPALALGSPTRVETNRAIRRSKRGIKAVLLDQCVISGIGNIYADEALWRTRLHYARPASRLSAGHAEELLQTTTAVLNEALRAGGTSFDALYVNDAGELGYFERSLQAYGRCDQPCYRCGSVIVREVFMNRSSFRCPQCQRRPRVTR